MERLSLILILVLAPHTKVPATEWIYPFRPTDVVLLTAAIVFLRWGPHSKRLFVATSAMLIAFFVAVASAIWGEYSLNLANLGSVAVGGALISYFPVAMKKLLLIATCFIGFQFLVSTISLSNAQILRYWYRGLAIAVILHSLCYVVTSDYFAVRAGIFVEGNHGGSYYLLSFFLMWFAQSHGLRFGRNGMLLAFGGVILTQSTTALVLLLPLAAAAYAALPVQNRKRTLNWPSSLLMISAVLGLSVVFGGEILTKLTGEDIDHSSFSRYDRLASIMSGINMFMEHPFFGVGIQGYAFALPQFVDPFIDSFFDWNSRRIANNIYIELLAEQGAVGLLAMLMVVYCICKPIFCRVRQLSILAAGSVSILLSWLAFPTYTVSFHWIGLAIFVRLAVQGLETVAPVRA